MNAKCIFLLAAILFVAAFLNAFGFALIIKPVPKVPPTRAETPSIKPRFISRENAEPRTPEKRQRRGATVIWIGSEDNLWSNPHNWKEGRVPGASDVVKFTGESKKPVVVDAAKTLSPGWSWREITPVQLLSTVTSS